MFSLSQIFGFVFKVVSQIVEAKLVVRAISNISRICIATCAWTQKFVHNLKRTALVALLVVLLRFVVRNVSGIVQKRTFMIKYSNTQTKKVINLSHPNR